MTLVAFFSVKGSPGVTTLTSLVGAAWPGPGRAALVEADPAGGDLAARFGLSARVGWASLTSSARRDETSPAITRHLQELPGGLPVLVCGRGDERRSADSIEGRSVRTAGEAVSGGGSGLTLVDLGRLDDDDPVSSSWLELAELSVVVIRGDVSSAVQVRVRAQRLIDSCGGKVAVVVVGGSHTSRDVAEFTGLLPLADLPSDPSAADLASGAAGGLRRLERSPLWAAVGRLTSALVPLLIETGQLGPELPDGAGPTGVTPPDPASTSEAVARGRGSFGPAVRRLRTTAGRRPTEIGRARS